MKNLFVGVLMGLFLGAGLVYEEYTIPTIHKSESQSQDQIDKLRQEKEDIKSALDRSNGEVEQLKRKLSEKVAKAAAIAAASSKQAPAAAEARPADQMVTTIAPAVEEKVAVAAPIADVPAAPIEIGDPDKVQLGPTKEVNEMDFQNWSPDHPKGIIVLATGNAGKIRPLIDAEIKEIEVWKQYALTHDLGISLVDLLSQGSPLAHGRGFYEVKQGSGDMLREGLRHTFSSDLPIFLYGRNESANRFIINLATDMPAKIGGWCCYGSGLMFAVPKLGMPMAPGIIASTTDSIWYAKNQNYFIKGRNIGRPWLFSSFKAANEDQFKDLVRSYYFSLAEAGLDNRPAGDWVSVENKGSIDLKADDTSISKTAWIPADFVGKRWVAIQIERPPQPTVIEYEVEVSKSMLASLKLGNNATVPKLKFYLRLPPGETDASNVDGVIAYCTWVSDRNALVQQLSFDTEQPIQKLKWPAVQMLRFASRHNLAVLTWSTPGKWNTGKDADQLTAGEQAKIDQEFTIYSDAWERGVRDLCSQYKLPEKDYLLYGMSRGAQWAHRLALRKPDRFLAVNIHVNSSYDEPTEAAKKIVWLVTTGELEHGYAGGQRFYAQCQKLGYPIMFKAGENLGHATRGDIEELRDQFFDYMLQVKEQRDNAAETGEPLDIAKFFSIANAKFVGDYLNQDLMPIEDEDIIDETKRVYLPTEELALAWKAPPPPDP